MAACISFPAVVFEEDIRDFIFCFPHSSPHQATLVVDLWSSSKYMMQSARPCVSYLKPASVVLHPPSISIQIAQNPPPPPSKVSAARSSVERTN
jgi:hypothetical protein